MNVRNCRDCGALIPGSATHCNDCSTAQEQRFERVRQYLSEHPNADLPALISATGVSEREVMQALRQGRLVAKSLAVEAVRCRRCGSQIAPGQICGGCVSQQAGKVRKGPGPRPEPRRSSGSRMHTDGIRKERRQP